MTHPMKKTGPDEHVMSSLLKLRVRPTVHAERDEGRQLTGR
jgi:hypothetical protein